MIDVVLVSRMSKMGYKSLFLWFLMTSTLFIISWFLVLRSTSLSSSVDLGILPNSKLRDILVNGNLDETPSSNGDSRTCSSNDVSMPVLKVYMYDLPSQFHFELLGWKNTGNGVWPDIRVEVPEYPGGLNLQHSIEYWLTLDLLSSEFDDNTKGRWAKRIKNASEADVIFVPFFSSISYNRGSKVKPGQKRSTNVVLQENLVKYLTSQEAWKKTGGKNHVIVAHHPNSLLDARMKLWPAMFILADFGRYPPTIANVEKDVIAPYMHIIKNYENDSSDFDTRRTLLYFQGAIYRKDGGIIRQDLYYMLRNESDVHFSFGTFQNDGIRKASEGMRSSKFCLNIAGDTPSSNRLFDAIASHCVPVVISDDIELPYEDVLDYSEFCVFIRSADALKENFVLNAVRSVGREEWTRRWRRLKEVEQFYEFRHPSRGSDAVQMIWQAVYRKVFAVKREIHRAGRFGQADERAVVRSAGRVPRNLGK